MSEKTTDNKFPYTCTPAYDRDACKGCVCPPATSRNSATGAAHVKIIQNVKNTVMLTKVHITTKYPIDIVHYWNLNSFCQYTAFKQWVLLQRTISGAPLA